MTSVSVLSRDKTDVSRSLDGNDRGKKMADSYLEKNDRESWSCLDSREARSAANKILGYFF